MMLSKVSHAIQYIVYDETGLSPEIRTCFAHECHTSKKILLLFVVVYNSRGREEEGRGRERDRERAGGREGNQERERAGRGRKRICVYL